MFDSVSDSEQTTSREQTSTEYDTDSQVNSDNIQKKLQDLNDVLTRENDKLRSQFEEAVRAASHIEEAHAKIAKLTKEVNDMSIEKDELNRRLDIALKANDELRQQFNNERQKMFELRNTNNNTLKKEMKKKQEEAKAQTDKLYEQIQILNDAKESVEMENKVTVSLIQRIITNASHYFRMTFNKADDLIKFLEQTPAMPPIVSEDDKRCTAKVNKIPANCSKDEKKKQSIRLLKGKIRKLKMELEEGEKARTGLEKDLSELRKDIKDISFNSNRTIDDLNRRIKQMTEDNSLAIDDYKHQIEMLEAKVLALKDEIKKKKEEFIKTTIEKNKSVVKTEVPKQVNHDKTEELQIAHDQMVQRTIELGKQVKLWQDKYDIAFEKTKELQSILKTKEASYDQMKNDLEAAHMVHQSTLDEIETLRNALHTKEPYDANETKRAHEVHALKGQLINLQNANDYQTKQIRELSSINERSSRTIEEQNSQIYTIKRELELAEMKNNELKEELLSTKQELADKVSQGQPDIMPPSIWKFNEFDSALASEIDRIALSPTLQPQTKLQHIYRKIYYYYRDLLSSKEQALENANKESQELKEASNQFLVDASIALAQKTYSPEEVLSLNNFKKVIDSINRIRGEFDEVKRRYEVYDVVVKHLIESMNFQNSNDPSSLISQINELKAQFITNKANISRLKKSISSMKSAYVNLKRKAENDSVEIKEENDHLKKHIASVSEANKDLISNTHALKREIHKQKLIIEDLNRNQADIDNRIKFETEHITKEKETIEKALGSQVEELTTKLKSSEETNFNNEIAINKLKKVNENMKTSITEKDQKIQNMIKENEATLKSFTDKWETEKQQIISSYESAIDEVKSQSEEQRKYVEKLVQDVTEAKQKAKKTKELNNSLKQDKTKLEKEVEFHKGQAQRAKKAAENAAQSKIISVEADFNAKLNENRARLENEKRKLFAFAADHFRQFFNPSTAIDENIFRSLIVRASSELARLMSSDIAIRKMVGADARQKTDEAVAKLVEDC